MPLVVNRKLCDEIGKWPVVLLSWCFSHTLILYSVKSPQVATDLTATFSVCYWAPGLA